MPITAKVISHSRVDVGVPDLITMQLRYPRFIHAEFMTHRVFSRNASSSRAVPVERMIQDAIDDPAMPVRWGANQPGMQDAGDHDAMLSLGNGIAECSPQVAWLSASSAAIAHARAFAAAGYHKQVVNRLLEPFGHISVVVTATEWDNFFALRCHPDADPTMRALAEAMRDAIRASEPSSFEPGWHLPYIQHDDFDAQAGLPKPESEMFSWLAMISAARSARVSYLNHDGSNPDIGKDIALAQRLLESKHMSPFEHQACADVRNHHFGWDNRKLHGNLVGWKQFRKMVEARTA